MPARACVPKQYNVMETTAPIEHPSHSDVDVTCLADVDSVSPFSADMDRYFATSDVVAAVVARNALNARWNILVQAPSAASSVVPSRPT